MNPDVISVRRNVWLSGVVAGLATLIGLAYLLRGSSVLDTVIAVVLLAVAALNWAGVAAARTPVLVADEHGIRLRVGLTWRGLPWGAVRQLVVEHGDHPLREGRLVVVPRDPSSMTDYLGGLGRLHLLWNELWFDAALSVPLGITTLTDSTDLGADLAALAGGRTDVVQLRGRQLAQLDEVVAPTREPDPMPEVEPIEEFEELETPTPPTTDALADLIEASTEPMPEPMPGPMPEPFLSAVEDPVGGWAEEPPEDEFLDEPEEQLPEPVAPLRALHHPARVEVRLDPPASVPTQREPEGHEPEDTAEVPDLEHVEAWEEVPVDIEADDLSVHAPDEDLPAPVELRPAPVIGPKIAHAREMLDMSIDELSQRTMIRAHVLEAIERDDFGPCGGDFYARGHLTSISRVLGLKLEPLMQEYDDRYAGGPINARRVFEAELATGMSGGMRATRGGPQWTMLIAVVLCLTLVWAVARLLSGDPSQVAAPPASSGDTAGLAANRQPITSPLMKTTPMTVTAAHASAHVVVRDRTGRILWSGDLRIGGHRQVVGLAPFKVESDNAGAVEVKVAGKALGTIGTPGEAGSKRFK